MAQRNHPNKYDRMTREQLIEVIGIDVDPGTSRHELIMMAKEIEKVR